MGHKIKIPKEMLMHIDFNNTINGGFSEATVLQTKEEHGYEVVVKIPGVEAEDLQLEIVNGKMSLFHLLPIFTHVEGDEEQWKTIRFISTIVIPAGVDQDNISARYDDDHRKLVMNLPFSHQQDDIRRKVEIERW
jgi:HSP20 family molecular chaperone IbpA